MSESNSNMQTVNVAVIGASGYTGLELIRFLLIHPKYRIVALTADSHAGKKIGDVFQHLNSYNLPSLIKVEDVDFSKIDAVFCCVPNGTSQNIISNIPDSIKVCDLSADFRFDDIKLYEKTYNQKHLAHNLQEKSVYGLTEINRDKIKKTRLVACPGCYPTSALLPLLPLIKKDIIKIENIIIDSKSGISGAGRTQRDSLLFTEVSDGFSAYGLINHRHRPEIESQLKKYSNNDVLISFTPHLLPIKRGILSTIYINTDEKHDITDIKDCLKESYEEEIFVSIKKDNLIPSTHDVRGSNFCHIGIFHDDRSKQIIIISVLDNLVKGASGQAIQNMNVMLGIDEKEGLIQGVIFP